MFGHRFESGRLHEIVKPAPVAGFVFNEIMVLYKMFYAFRMKRLLVRIR